MPFGLGAPELLIILLIVVVIFGAGKLPEIGSALGRSIRGFKSEVTDAQKEEAAKPVKSEAKPAEARSITNDEVVR
jgi:sec-independent protein translocase protein TatA